MVKMIILVVFNGVALSMTCLIDFSPVTVYTTPSVGGRCCRCRSRWSCRTVIVAVGTTISLDKVVRRVFVVVMEGFPFVVVVVDGTSFTATL